MYLKKPFSFHQKNNTSKIAINCKYELDIFTSNILQPTLDLLSDVIIFSSLIFLLLIFDPIVTTTTVVIFSSIIFAYQKFLKKKTSIWAKERLYFDGLINKVITDLAGTSGYKEGH